MFKLSRTISRNLVTLSRTVRQFNYRPMEPQPNFSAVDVEKRKGNHQGGRGSQDHRNHKRQKTQKQKPIKEGSTEEVLLADVSELFAKQRLNDLKHDEAGIEVDNSETRQSLPAPFTELDVTVLEISSTGDGLAIAPGSDQIYVVPFTAPGDIARVKVIKHFEDQHYSLADFLSIVEPSPLRDDSRISCKYFSKCSGCQFQMLDYPTQLNHKKSVVEKAYRNFSNLPSELIPAVLNTMGSPLQYNYRTKLTPHFDGPPGYRKRADARAGIKKSFEKAPDIGFMQKNRRITLDIEDCPIGTDAVRKGMKKERQRVLDELDKYKRGATILLRESTQRVSNSKLPSSIPEDTIAIPVEGTDSTDLKTCITDNNAVSTEYIDDFTFTNPAGAFFQNNNSILPPFTQYIRENILPPPSSGEKPVKYLIDAYSGSGLFTITLSSLFASSTGIDISSASIDFASKNASLNNIPSSKASFLAADAPELFKSVTYPPDETVVIIDPPRKGCDDSFLRQLLRFGPRRVVYVSCNVHTQARDVGVMVHGYVNGKDAREGLGSRYKIESLRGFDFFPQTGHVEGVAVLSKVDEKFSEALPAEAMSGMEKELGADVADAEGIIATGAVEGVRTTTDT